MSAQLLPVPENEPPLGDLDEACLKLKVPNTGRPWLDAIIEEGRRLDTLQAVFCGLNEKPKNAEHSAHQSDEYLVSRLIQAARQQMYELFDERR